MRLRSARSNRYLDELRDSAKDLELNSQRPHMEDNEFTRCIRALENKLDKAMIKYNEAQSIRKTYEQIVKRLKEERVGFDNQLTAVERTLGAKLRDYDELLLLGGKLVAKSLLDMFSIQTADSFITHYSVPSRGASSTDNTHFLLV